MEQAHQQPPLATFPQLARTEWFTRLEESSIWVRAYRVLGLTKDDLPQRIIVDLHSVRAVIQHGKLVYPHQVGLEVISRREIKIHASKARQTTTLEGSFLLLITPYEVDGQTGDELALRENLNSIAGLFLAFNGLNMVYDLIFDIIVDMGSRGAVSSSAGPLQTPSYFQIPDVGEQRLSDIRKAEEAIYKSSAGIRSRSRLSLRWFEAAIRENSPADSFLKYWIALETIAVAQPAKIKRICEILGQAYGISGSEARDKFSISKLAEIRYQVVHLGRERPPINMDLGRYMEALYVDILFERLGLLCERRSESVLSQQHVSDDMYITLG